MAGSYNHILHGWSLIENMGVDPAQTGGKMNKFKVDH